MTVALLDPCLFDPTVHEDGLQGVVSQLNDLLLLCRRRRIQIPTVEEYWADLARVCIRPTEGRCTSEIMRRPFLELRKMARPLDLPPYADGTRVWGFRHLFEDLGQPEDAWADRLAEAAVRCCRGDHEIIVFVASVEGRNLCIRRHDDTALREYTRWLLHTQPRGVGPCHLPCWHHPRNAEVDWTTRYDYRLPATQDRAKFPFCPVPEWKSMGVEVWRTVQSRPTFPDAHGHAWARPGINEGAGDHWDVYLDDQRTRRRLGGVPRLNITAWGATSDRDEGPGSIHHEGDQAGRINRRASGWSCPD